MRSLATATLYLFSMHVASSLWKLWAF
jgi:hypothetical protein